MAVRTENNWLFVDFYCYLPDGRRVRCRERLGLMDTRKNRQRAESMDRAISYELRHGKFNYLHFFPHGSKAGLFDARPPETLFSEWWDRWLAEKTIREGTRKGLRSAYRSHLGPHFSHYRLSDITESEILLFRNLLTQKGLREGTINDRLIKPLCMALLKAHKRGLLPQYPCEEIRRLVEPGTDIDPFSFTELKVFLAVLAEKRPDYYDMIELWSRTGLRPGEFIALKWKCVDYFNRKLLVRETRLPTGKEGPPKTKHSIRDVDMSEAAIAALKRQEARTGLIGSYIFMTRAQKPFSDAFLRKKFHHLLKLAGLKYRPPQQMRHTFATLHIAAGENITWVSRMLGHATPQTTLKRYNRFIPNLTRQDGSAFEGALQSEERFRQLLPKADEKQRKTAKKALDTIK